MISKSNQTIKQFSDVTETADFKTVSTVWYNSEEAKHDGIPTVIHAVCVDLFSVALVSRRARREHVSPCANSSPF